MRNKQQPRIESVCTFKGVRHDFYTITHEDLYTLYNIVPSGSDKPLGGYPDYRYLMKVKGYGDLLPEKVFNINHSQDVSRNE